VKDDFGVADAVAGLDAQGTDKIGGDFGFLEALDLATVFADKVWVQMSFGVLGVAQCVSPDAVFSADAVEDVFAGEGVEGTVDGDGIGVRGELFQHLNSTQRSAGFGEDFQDASANGRAAKL
jgi:hypothetical protein